MRDPGELAHVDLAREAEHAVVGRVHAQDRSRLRSERPRVVGRARAVGRADLAQPGARALHDLGDAEAVADLHELAARDHDLAPACERGEREHQRGRAVVDADGRLCARQLADERRDVVLPRAAPAGGEIELQIRIAGGHGLHALERGVRQRRPPEVRVEDDARGVEHRSQRRLERRAHAAAELGCERCGGRVLALRAPFGQRRARLAHAERVRRIACRLAHEQVDRWQRTRHVPYRRAVAHGGGGGSNPRYTASGRAPRPSTACRGRARGSNTRERGLLSVDDAHESTGDAAVWPAEPRARAPSSRPHDARRRSSRCSRFRSGTSSCSAAPSWRACAWRASRSAACRARRPSTRSRRPSATSCSARSR